MQHPLIGTTGAWRRHGTEIILDDPFVELTESENGSGGSTPPRRRGGPSGRQIALLKEFLGSGATGARARLADFRIPPGLTATTLRWYAALARRALADPRKATPAAQVVQTLRLQLVAMALSRLK